LSRATQPAVPLGKAVIDKMVKKAESLADDEKAEEAKAAAAAEPKAEAKGGEEEPSVH
jgi:hypothetical protein